MRITPPALNPNGGDASAVVVTPSGAPSSRTLAAHLADALDFRDFGVVGDGTADDTAALQAAVNYSAAHGVPVRGWAAGRYKVASSGNRTFLGPTGNPSSHPVGLVLRDGALVDFGGGRLVLAPGDLSTIALGNEHADGTHADAFTLRNLVIDGGGRDVSTGPNARTEATVWLRGFTRSIIDEITVQNANYIACSLAAFTFSEIGTLRARSVTGQGFTIGGNTSDSFSDSTLGTLISEDVADFGTFSQPGNGFFVSGHRYAVGRILGRNLSGGHKIGPGNLDVSVGLAVFDGLALGSEADNGTDNCGFKVQGDIPDVTGTATADGSGTLTAVTTTPVGGSAYVVGRFLYGPQVPYGAKITAVGSGTLTLDTSVPAGAGLAIAASSSMPPDRVTVGQVVTRNAYGYGMYLWDCGSVQVGEFRGYRNARHGTDAEIECTRVRNLEVGSVVSVAAGTHGLNVSSGCTRVHVGSAYFRNFGDVTADSTGVLPLSGEVTIDRLETVCDRSAANILQSVAALSDNIVRVGEFRSSGITACTRIQFPRHWLGNPIIGSGTDAIHGEVTLSAAASSTDIANANIKTASYNGGFVNPIVERWPLNESARALGLPRYGVPNNFLLRLYHAPAVGDERFGWRLAGYAWSDTALPTSAADPARVASRQATAARAARTPRSGEAILDTDTGVLYVGDGATPGGVAVSAGGGGSVASVFGRTGTVAATTGDYAVSQVTGAAPLASPALTGTPTAPTAAPGTNTTQVATTAFAQAAVAALVNAAPSTLDTLGEIASTLASDESTAAALAITVGGKLTAASNLSDLASAATARTSLGLGTAATTNSTAYATAAQGTKADSALQPAAIGTNVQAWDADLDGLAGLGTTGFVRRTGAGTFAASALAEADLPATAVVTDANQTISGDITFGDGTGAAQTFVNGAAGSIRDVVFETAGVARWRLRCNDDAETGTNAGSNLVVIGRKDDGTGLGNWMVVRRSDGLVTFGGVTITQAGVVTATSFSGSGAGLTSVPVKALYVQTADVTVDSAVAGTTETTLIDATGAAGSAASSTIPSSEVAAGAVFEVELSGTLTTPAAVGNLQLKIKLGTAVLDSSAQGLTVSMTARFWMARARFTVRAVSATAAVRGVGIWTRANSANASEAVFGMAANGSAFTVNTSGTLAVAATVTYSNSTSGTITCDQLTIRKVHG